MVMGPLFMIIYDPWKPWRRREISSLSCASFLWNSDRGRQRPAYYLKALSRALFEKCFASTSMATGSVKDGLWHEWWQARRIGSSRVPGVRCTLYSSKWKVVACIASNPIIVDWRYGKFPLRNYISIICIREKCSFEFSAFSFNISQTMQGLT